MLRNTKKKCFIDKYGRNKNITALSPNEKKKNEDRIQNVVNFAVF